jgi:hypothetical protein
VVHHLQLDHGQRASDDALQRADTGDAGQRRHRHEPGETPPAQLLRPNPPHGALLLQEGNVLGGTFRLSFWGQTTASLAYNAQAYQVQTALEDLSLIGGVEVVR